MSSPTRRGAASYAVAGFGAILALLALVILEDAVSQLDMYVARFGWGYTAVPLTLILPGLAAVSGAVLSLSALRGWRRWWWPMLVAVWVICAVAFVLLPLRD